MAGTPTACHAFNLFSLMMESRFGGSWRTSAKPDDVVSIADEIVLGFGGTAHEQTSVGGDGAHQTVWRFPDGSRARTSCYGLQREDQAEQAA